MSGPGERFNWGCLIALTLNFMVWILLVGLLLLAPWE
jgi:hypothetical protein